jgi:HAD superfamily hydrolase (TIGR01549 family)
MPEQYDFVFFDAGGTLLGTNTDHENWYEQFFVEACAAHGRRVTAAQVGESLAAASATCHLERRCSTPDQVFTFWEHMYARVFRDLLPGLDCLALAHHYIDRFEAGEYVRPFPDAMECLRGVRRLGVRMAVVSNFGAYLSRFLARTGIADFLEFEVISASEGCEKPHPEIYERDVARAGVQPGRILFVGDHPVEDYEGARRHGMHPVLVDRHGRHASRAGLRRVASLTEIPRLLDGAS